MNTLINLSYFGFLGTLFLGALITMLHAIRPYRVKDKYRSLLERVQKDYRLRSLNSHAAEEKNILSALDEVQGLIEKGELLRAEAMINDLARQFDQFLKSAKAGKIR